METRIIIFEDNNNLRETLCLLLNMQPNFTVCGDFEQCINAEQITKKLQPDVVLMDIDMPEMTGIEGLKLVKKAKPNTDVIIHTVFEDDERLFSAFCHGASGYLLKKYASEHLVDAIKEALNGGAPMSMGIAKRVLATFSKPLPEKNYSLTKREQEVIHWLSMGYSYKMIAAKCFLSIETVKSHLKNSYIKLQVNCATEAVSKAIKENLV